MSVKVVILNPSSNVTPSDPETPVLSALIELFQSLNENRIRYCHWKSNIRLEKSLQGKTDFDLLVAREDSLSFRHILIQKNIKLLVAAPGHEYPSMENYLGMDEATGQFFHLHVHYKLVLGEQYVKNYGLPIEYDFLDKVHLVKDVKVPLPELEIVVLAIRVLLKYRFRDFVKDMTPLRGPGINQGFRTEIKWLLAQTSVENIEQTLHTWKDLIDPNHILEFLQIAQSGRKAGYKIQRIKNRIKRRFGLYQRANTLSASVIYFRELWKRRKFWRNSPVTKMTFAEGGQTIALIGADGAGKSTMKALLIEWLSWKLDIHNFYLGSKEPSRRSSFYYLVFRMARRLLSPFINRNVLERFFTQIRDIPLFMHHHSTGRDRNTRLAESRKRTLAGSIVLFDRYPLEAFDIGSVDLYEMDGPKIRSLADGRNDFIARWFDRAEQKLYENLLLPDCVVVLDVSPEVSIARKPDHDPATLEAKIKGVRSLIDVIRTNHPNVRLIQIDADQTLDDVFLQLKRKIWETL